VSAGTPGPGDAAFWAWRSVVAALVLSLGWVLTSHPVPIYDGVWVPDEPYRYVQAPAGSGATAAPTVAHDRTPVAQGLSTVSLNVYSAEQGPQFSLFIPKGALAAPSGVIDVRAVPGAATEQPPQEFIGGNVEDVTLTDPQGKVTLTSQAKIAAVYLRASAPSDGWVMWFRPPAGSWTALASERGGTDSYAATFAGAGQYAMAKAATVTTRQSGARSSRGGGQLLYVVLGCLLAVMVVVITVLRRAGSAQQVASR
jgi:hypothetical protein